MLKADKHHEGDYVMAIQTHTLAYTDSTGVTLKSHYAYPANTTTPKPAVLVAPEWWGLSAHAKHAAERLAEAGYVALTMDLYGNAQLTDDASVASANMTGLLNNPALLAERTQLALQTLQAQPQVQANQLAAIGFCFGGKVVLDMARRGAPLQAVTSFHGNLTPETPAQAGKVQAELLIEHGSDDPLAPPEMLQAFEAEMQAAGVRYHIDTFPGVRHGFTNPQATANGEKNNFDALRYDADAAQTSWQNMLALLERTLLGVKANS